MSAIFAYRNLMFLLAPRTGNASAGPESSRHVSVARNGSSAPWTPSVLDAPDSAPRHGAPPSEIAPLEPYGASHTPSSGYRVKPDLSDWKVLPHEPIQRLSENVWRVEGELGRFGMRRVMTIAKMSDGRLVLHSAIALDEPSMEAIESWGTPAYLLVPHTRHRMDAARYKKRFPELKVLATSGALEKARAVVAVDGTYEDFPADEAVELFMLRGVSQKEGAMVVRSRDGVTLVLNEVVFNLPRPNGFAERAALRLLGLGPGPRVTSVVKAELVDDAAALRGHLEELAELPGLTRLVVSHHVMAHGSAAPLCLQLAARSL